MSGSLARQSSSEGGASSSSSSSSVFRRGGAAATRANGKKEHDEEEDDEEDEDDEEEGGEQKTKSAFRGVSWAGKKWRSQIKPTGQKLVYLGCYGGKKGEEDAAKAYDEALRRLLGRESWHKLNFPNAEEAAHIRDSGLSAHCQHGAGSGKAAPKGRKREEQKGEKRQRPLSEFNIFMQQEIAAMKVRQRSSAVERCGPHVAISPVMLRSSNAAGDRCYEGRAAGNGAQGTQQEDASVLPVPVLFCGPCPCPCCCVLPTAVPVLPALRCLCCLSYVISAAHPSRTSSLNLQDVFLACTKVHT